MREFDFYPLHKSVWIRPNYLFDDFWRLLFEYDLHEYVKIMLVEVIEGDQEFKRYFKLLDRKSGK